MNAQNVGYKRKEEELMMVKNHSRGSLPYFFEDILQDSGCPFEKIETETKSGKKFVHYILTTNPKGSAIVSMNNSIQKLEKIMDEYDIPDGQLKQTKNKKNLSIMGELNISPNARPGYYGSVGTLYTSEKPNYTEKIIFPTYK